MEIAALTSTLASADLDRAAQNAGPDKTADVSQQFEAILLRQMLGESMKPLLENGPSGQVYGYMLTDALATSLSKGGGLGLASVLQSQLGGGAK